MSTVDAEERILGQRTLRRRRMVKGAAATSAALLAASWIRPDMRAIGIPVALATSGPPTVVTPPICEVTYEGTTNAPAGEPAGMSQYNANVAGVVDVHDYAVGVLSIKILTNANFLTAIPDASYTDATYHDHYRRFTPGSLGTVTYSPATTAQLNIWAVRINPAQGAQLIVRVTNASNLVTDCDPQAEPVAAAPHLNSLQITVNGTTFTAAEVASGSVSSVAVSPDVVNADNSAVVTGLPDSSANGVVLAITAS